MDKAELRKQLARATQRFEEVYGGEVVRYAAYPAEKIRLGSYRKVPNLKETAYREELRRIESERARAGGAAKAS